MTHTNTTLLQVGTAINFTRPYPIRIGETVLNRGVEYRVTSKIADLCIVARTAQRRGA